MIVVIIVIIVVIIVVIVIVVVIILEQCHRNLQVQYHYVSSTEPV